MKKILFVSPSPIWGGASTANIGIARIFMQLGWSVIYVDEYLQADEYLGVNISHLPVHAERYHQERLYDYIMTNSFEAVFWGNYLMTFYYLQTIIKLRRREVSQYVVLHSVGLSNTLKSKVLDSSFAFASRYFDRIVCVSEYTVDCWRKKHGFLKAIDAVRVVPNSICIPDCFEKTAHKGIHVGFVGRFSEEKQPELFCKLSNCSPYNYLAWGDGPLLNSLRLSYPRVDFKGLQLDIDEIYSNIDVLVMTSKFENCPMVVLEAMARGIPCVCPSVGGIPEIVDSGVDGILYDGYSPETIVHSIDTILADYQFFSSRCKQRAFTFSPEAISDKWEAVIV